MSFDTELLRLDELGLAIGKTVGSFNAGSQALELSYHLHAKWTTSSEYELNGMCGAAYTGGHYDATEKCGPASGYQGTASCSSVDYTCLPTDTAGCETGDLSGLTGKLVISDGEATASVSTSSQAAVKGDYRFQAGVADGALFSSVVFHGDNLGAGNRVLCARLDRN